MIQFGPNLMPLKKMLAIPKVHQTKLFATMDQECSHLSFQVYH